MCGGTENVSTLIWRVGTAASGAVSLSKLFAETHTCRIRLASNSPFRCLAACLQLAEREKSKWEQSCQEQSERGWFWDGSATAASTASSSGAAAGAADTAKPAAVAFSGDVSARGRDGVALQRY